MAVRATVALAVLVALCAGAGARAQSHLLPDAGAFGDPRPYHVKVRQVFSAGYERGVVLSAVILPSFDKERLVGIRRASGGWEVFSLSPTSSIWAFELRRMHEEGRMISVGADGKAVPLEDDPQYQSIKRRTPSDLRDITAVVETQAIDSVLAERIEKVWRRMLLGTRFTTEPILGRRDGTNYHYSMWQRDYGTMSGYTWSPESGPTKLLVDLTEELVSYAAGKSGSAALEARLAAAEKF